MSEDELDKALKNLSDTIAACSKSAVKLLQASLETLSSGGRVTASSLISTSVAVLKSLRSVLDASIVMLERVKSQVSPEEVKREKVQVVEAPKASEEACSEA